MNDGSEMVTTETPKEKSHMSFWDVLTLSPSFWCRGWWYEHHTCT